MEGTKLGDIGSRKALSEALKASILGQGYRLDDRTLPFLLQNAMTKASGRGFAWRVNMGVLFSFFAGDRGAYFFGGAI